MSYNTVLHCSESLESKLLYTQWSIVWCWMSKSKLVPSGLILHWSEPPSASSWKLLTAPPKAMWPVWKSRHLATMGGGVSTHITFLLQHPCSHISDLWDGYGKTPRNLKCNSKSARTILRRKFQINSCAELVTDQEGNALYLVSTGTTQFLQHRELLLAKQIVTRLNML